MWFMSLNKNDKILVIALSLLLLIGFVLGWLVIHETVLPLFLVTVVLIAAQFTSYRRLQQQAQDNYAQIESLFSLFSVLKIRYPLPPMRDWAISPDFATIIVSLIRERKPNLIVETGSGVSTLITAYALEQLGKGRVVSLEQDEKFASISATNVEKSGLQGIATVVYTSLKKIKIGDKSWLWYDIERLGNLGTIDMLIIDGPGKLPVRQRLGRYPALPLLYSKLSDDAVIVADDIFKFKDEEETLHLWMKEFDDFTMTKLQTEKGAAVLRRRAGQ